MSPGDFEFICRLVRRRSGIVVAIDKTYLVETRLSPLLRRRQLSSISEIVQRLRAGDPALEKLVVEAMTTNETLFFRDRTPFEHFQNLILPSLMGSRPRGSTVRIWCAACSSGQEPYSIAMLLDDLGLVGTGWNFQITGTDISEAMIERAREGIYTQFEVQRGLPVKLLIKFFAQDGQTWQIDKRLRDKVTFKSLNLLDDFSALGRFDVIFCRNVLIYFDDQTKTSLMNRLARALTPDGFLVLGSAESPYGLTESLARHQEEPNVMVRADGPLAAHQLVPATTARAGIRSF